MNGFTFLASAMRRARLCCGSCGRAWVVIITRTERVSCGIFCTQCCTTATWFHPLAIFRLILPGLHVFFLVHLVLTPYMCLPFRRLLLLLPAPIS